MHCGQYFNTYYSPSSIINALYKNGIKKAWISSTTSCITWQTAAEKEYIISKIDEEIQAAFATAENKGMTISPLYWVSYQRCVEGERIADIMDGSLYKGFKIHPKTYGWNSCDNVTKELLGEVCEYATKNSLPILIHTGSEYVDMPSRFECFFEKYSDAKFVLAHCKATEQIIRIFNKYSNVYGDTSFCSCESYEAICEAGFESKMLFGTDFPITHWYNKHSKKRRIPKENLCKHYKSLINQRF